MRVLPALLRSTFAAWLVLAALAPSAPAAQQDGPPALPDVVRDVLPKVVKIYGAGGFRGLESYQSGVVISEDGNILTVWSYVLDTDVITVTLDDGRRYEAQLVGADPATELAVIKIEAEDLLHFPLAASAAVDPGATVLAFSNLFGVATGDEPVSVQRGVVAAKAPLAARRGAFETPYRGAVYLLDAVTNNPGAAGGALTDAHGRLVAMLGKELRHATANTWLNYALPIEEISSTVDEILSGKFVSRPADAHDEKPERAVDLAALGIRLVPDVLPRTPPYVDAVVAGSPAALAGLKADDLIVAVGGQLVPSYRALAEELSYIEHDAEVTLSYKRGAELITVTLRGQNTQPSETP